jgi:hypothetical protein
MIFNKCLPILFLCIVSYVYPNITSSGFENFPNHYFVETGTYVGGSVKLALHANFQEIYSIEIDGVLAAHAQTMFKDFNHVHIVHGDSSQVLWDIIKDMNKPITFWLDGHNSSGIPLPQGRQNTPLLHELEQIKRHPIRTHTILIDDVRLLGTWEFDFITKEQLIQKVLEINPDYVITYIDGYRPNDIMVAQIAPHRAKFAGTHHISASQHAITFQQGSRLGDEILSYSIAKWLSYKYNIPFYFTPFKFSDAFSIDKVDIYLDQGIKNTFANVIEIQTEDELIRYLKTGATATLFSVSYATGVHYPSQLVEGLNWPTMYTNMYFYAKEHSLFGSELKRALTISAQIREIKLPHDKITVAVHVRKGSGDDTQLTSVQYLDEWNQILSNNIRKPTLLQGTDMWCPRKLPPEQFYVDQIIKLSNLLNHQPLLVYIFTDDKHPDQIVERFKKRIPLPNISFDYGHNDASNLHAEENSIIDDIYNMSRFDCLIKPESGFDLIAQFIGAHKIIIYPQDSIIRIEQSLNQAMICIQNVSIIFHNPETNTTKYFNFNAITDEHRKQISQLFNVVSSPSREIPASLYNDYTMNNKLPVFYVFRDDGYSDNNPIIYSKEEIDDLIHKAQQQQTLYYGATDTYLYQALKKYGAYIRNKNIAILGSVVPWYESIILAYGGLPTTIEYNKIISQDPRLRVTTVAEYDKYPQLFDALISISSFEHDGLGRYGDRLDPLGDIKAMRKSKTMLKKDGLLFLAVPVGKDKLIWNLHRIYGETRFPLLIDGWDVIDAFGFNSENFQNDDPHAHHQPVFVLRPK